MKINYIIFLVVLLIVGNYLRLKVEENNVPKIEINEEVEYQKEGAEKLNKIESKKDINTVTYGELIKLGFTKKQSEKIIEFKKFIGKIENLEDLKRIPRFGDTGLSKAKKTLYVNTENTVENDVTDNEKKYNINKISDDEMKLLGLTKKEIKDVKLLREKGEIRSNIDLKEIFSEKRYSEIERSIEFEGE
mgnify:FL=1